MDVGEEEFEEKIKTKIDVWRLVLKESRRTKYQSHTIGEEEKEMKTIIKALWERNEDWSIIE